MHEQTNIDQLSGKLENIISGHRVNPDDADWLRGVLLRTASVPVLPELETPDMHAAVMNVVAAGVQLTNTDALWQAYRKSLPQLAGYTPSGREARDRTLLFAARCCDSIDAPGTWDEDDHRWRVETHNGTYFGATLDDALIDFWRSTLQAVDRENAPLERDPFVLGAALQPENAEGIASGAISDAPEPTVPASVVALIQAYGDARADRGKSGAALGAVITALRACLAKASAETSCIPSALPVGWQEIVARAQADLRVFSAAYGSSRDTDAILAELQALLSSAAGDGSQSQCGSPMLPAFWWLRGSVFPSVVVYPDSHRPTDLNNFDPLYVLPPQQPSAAGPAFLRELAHWLHAAYDRPPQTPEVKSLLRRLDATVRGPLLNATGQEVDVSHHDDRDQALWLEFEMRWAQGEFAPDLTAFLKSNMKMAAWGMVLDFDQRNRPSGF